jgi:hypothetical protein
MPSPTTPQQACATIQAAIRTMAQGTQSDPNTVALAVAQLQTALGDTVAAGTQQLAAALLPCLRDLLHAAGWLHHCFAPGNSLQLPDPLPDSAQRVWVTCMSAVNRLLCQRSPRTLASLQSLLEPCRRPQVPGGSCCPLVAVPGVWDA